MATSPSRARARRDDDQPRRPPGERGLGRVAAATVEGSGGLCSDEDVGARVPRPARRARDEAGYERWLARQTERLDPLMAFLGVVFSLIVAFQFAQPGLSDGWARALDASTWVLWVVFVLEFLARFGAAPSKPRFLRRHWLAVAMLLVPTLRLLRFGALLRIGRALPAARVVSTSYRATGGARRLVRSRTSFLAAVTVIATLALAQLAWLVERGQGTFATFGDALLWAASAVVATQGDPVPETAVGRLLMVGGFGVGLVLVATLAGTVGAYLLEEHRERVDALRDRA